MSDYNGYNKAEILKDDGGYFVRLWSGEKYCDEPVENSTRQECLEFIEENELELLLH